MKQMSLIEMDGFLKGKCIPCDLKVNETNAEYLVRKFAELESKLETALRECRSAGITIDNLEAKCAALAADNEKAMEAMRLADAAVKLAHEKFSALAAENAGMKEACGGDGSYRDCPACAHSEYIEAPETPVTDAFLAEVRSQGVEMFVGKISHSLRTAGGGDGYHEEPYHEFADYLESKDEDFAVQLRKEAAQ